MPLTKNASIVFRSDSKSAVGWMNGRPPRDANAVEYRRILRLQQGLHEEFQLLKKIVPDSSVLHLSGEDNSEADYLSRILYIQVAPESPSDQF
jgi:hypothetical protein